MKIVADESVDRQIVAQLRAAGHEVAYVAELEPGIPDELVLLRSRESDAVLITADKDFGELVFRQRLLHSGVLLLRLAGILGAALGRGNSTPTLTSAAQAADHPN